MRPLLQLLDLLGRHHADRSAAERRHEIADRGRREAHPHAFHVVGGADRLLDGMHVARLVGEQQQQLDAAMLGVEIFRPQLGVVERLGADLGAADKVGELHQLGQREAPGGRAVQEPGDVGLPGAREVVVLRHRTHLRPGEALDRDASARLLLQIVRPLDQPARHGVLVAHEIGELHLEFLLRQDCRRRHHAGHRREH